MASYAEARISGSEPDCIVERISVCHKRRRGEHAFTMRFDNPGIYVVRETEIVGVDDDRAQLENVELDTKEFLRIRAKVAKGVMQLAHRPSRFIE